MPIENSVSVAAGSTVVDGYLTQFVAAPGDTFILNGLSFVVERQETSARLILADPWPGEELTDQANWELVRTSPYWQSTVTVNSKITDLIQRLEAGLPFKPDAVGTLEDRAAYDEQEKGFTFLRIDTDPFLLYVKQILRGWRLDAGPGPARQGCGRRGVPAGSGDVRPAVPQDRRRGLDCRDERRSRCLRRSYTVSHAEQSAQAAALSATASEEFGRPVAPVGQCQCAERAGERRQRDPGQGLRGCREAVRDGERAERCSL